MIKYTKSMHFIHKFPVEIFLNYSGLKIKGKLFFTLLEHTNTI